MPKSRIWVLLHQVEGPVNLGAVCRAMANTGFDRLGYTGSLDGDDPLARQFAVHALPILNQARRESSLQGLIGEVDRVFGFSPRALWQDGRNLDLEQFHRQVELDLASGRSIGLLFGNEARGLANSELAGCDFRVALPSVDAYSSLNLAQAVLVVLWELHRRWTPVIAADHAPVLATGPAKRTMLANIRGYLEGIDFLNPQNPEYLWQEIQPIFLGRDWTEREVVLLNAVFSKGLARFKALLAKLEKHGSP